MAEVKTATIEQTPPVAPRDAQRETAFRSMDEAQTATIVETPHRDDRRGLQIFLDVGYDWPQETRPRKERQGALIKQLANFLEVCDSKKNLGIGVSVRVSGSGVTAIEDRLVALGGLYPSSEISWDSSDTFFRSSELIYLSPDAEEVLDTSRGFPTGAAFVVGGLVDRKVKRGRSLKRASDCGIRSAQLNLPGDYKGAPLNIDTVLSILYYWKAFDSVDSQHGDATSFEKACACALFEHQKRHPNQGEHVF